MLQNKNQKFEKSEKQIILLDATRVMSQHDEQHFSRYNHLQTWIEAATYENMVFIPQENMCYGL